MYIIYNVFAKLKLMAITHPRVRKGTEKFRKRSLCFLPVTSFLRGGEDIREEMLKRDLPINTELATFVPLLIRKCSLVIPLDYSVVHDVPIARCTDVADAGEILDQEPS